MQKYEAERTRNFHPFLSNLKNGHDPITCLQKIACQLDWSKLARNADVLNFNTNNFRELAVEDGAVKIQNDGGVNRLQVPTLLKNNFFDFGFCYELETL